ncbi:MAG TPA: hypothetical protein VHQ23_11660 [Ilumatobacteraceae bacterium]|nr:hypothetical protein [Ilumatobacteraceae bacterium]
MSAAAPPDALALLVTAVDEMRETTSLIPVAEASRSLNRSRRSNFAMLFARSRSEINAGNAMQYLGDNIERARAHWREALSALADLQRLHGGNDVIAELGAQLPIAGLDSVLPRLELEAIPRPTNKAAIHLAAVVETIHDCEHLAATARTKLNLQRMRAD